MDEVFTLANKSGPGTGMDFHLLNEMHQDSTFTQSLLSGTLSHRYEQITREQTAKLIPTDP
jgi:hypothetical protein